MTNLNSSTDKFVGTITHLKGRPKEDRALEMLQKIASLVKPIMRKHGWFLPVLSEFFPSQDNLLGLNVNAGQKILIRLRPAHSPDSFYEEEDVIQTMLHELTHNVHGPHDDKFYKFLSGLQDEFDALQSSGYAGEGFFSKGHRVGAEVSHDLPPHLARLKALEAAEKRRNMGGVLGGRGRALGGRINTAGLTPRELAARAAERRARDEKACGSGEMAIKEAEKAAKESIEHKVIDLTLDSDDEVEIGPSKPRAIPAKIAAGSRPAARAPPASRPAPYPKRPPPALAGEWTCRTCTLRNTPLALQCDACLSIRPVDDRDTGGAHSGWVCHACGELGNDPDFWTCRGCGTVKLMS
ncbi:WLM-domain-containing protein [Roridomyces roridus]|uniref:WLM-domain-containing protein n=1 Tax=Roridomyces roridus TaxID=1738132 RepID=A0AAD7C6M8_9AGAR|nr:WLM-domain-containing protein [Roridomyces roridus]